MPRRTKRKGQFQVLVEEGPPRGDLYELAQTTYHQVVDTHSKEIVMTFQGEVQASLSTTAGMWDEPHFSGVREVTIAPDEQSVIVQYYDSRKEKVQLPK